MPSYQQAAGWCALRLASRSDGAGAAAAHGPKARKKEGSAAASGYTAPVLGLGPSPTAVSRLQLNEAPSWRVGQVHGPADVTSGVPLYVASPPLENRSGSTPSKIFFFSS